MVFRSLPWSSPAQARLEKKAPWVLWDSEEDDEIQEKATEVEKKKKVRVYKWRH